MAIVQLTYFRLSFISKIVHEVQCTFIKEASKYTFTDTVVSFSLMLSHGQAHSLYGQAVIMHVSCTNGGALFQLSLTVYSVVRDG